MTTSHPRQHNNDPASRRAASGPPGPMRDGALNRAGDRPQEAAPGSEKSRPEPSAQGTQRRLRALMNRSWSPQALQKATGIPAVVITTILDGGRTPGRAVNERIATAYDQLWNKPPPLGTARDRELADAAGAHARKHGWPPPMAYDDDQIDLPGGDAEPGWQRSTRTSRPRADLSEDLAFVREHGGYRQAPISVAAMRLGVTREALEQAQCRTARADREAEAG
jgi:hypothetical protein